MKAVLLTATGLLVLAAAPAVAKPGHGHSTHDSRNHGWSYSERNCPPGLAKKNNGCLPPGIAKKRYNVGQRYATSYGNRWSYSQIPYAMRQQYRLNSNDRYYYRDGYLYQVNPRTMLIEQVLSALTRPY